MFLVDFGVTGLDELVAEHFHCFCWRAGPSQGLVVRCVHFFIRDLSGFYPVFIRDFMHENLGR